MSRLPGSGRRMLAMAGGTAASRLTGLLRVLVLAWVLGFTPIADAFNLANTVPNMLFDLVLGGVLSATFIPVFVERLAQDGERRAWRSISSVLSLALVTLAGATVLAWWAAPWIIDGFTLLGHAHASSVSFLDERALATSFLRWFVPQIFFYGVIGLTTALLNIRHRFTAASWVPVANNVVCIAVLVWFHLVDPDPTLATLEGSSHLAWLAAGTTAGVAVQFALLWPSLRHAGLDRLRFRLDVADPAVKAVGRLGSWTLAVVLTNQASLYVVLAMAFALGGNGPVSAYTYGWSFMQMPYAVVVVSVLGVLTPQLAALATAKDHNALAEQLTVGLRQSLGIIVPSSVGMIVLAQPLVGVLLNHLHAAHRLAAGTVLAVLAAGLPGFTIFQLCVRGLQSLQRAREVFLLYVLDNGVTIAVALWLGRHSLAGLTASVSLGYALSALAALGVLRRHHVSLAGAFVGRMFRNNLLGSLLTGLAMATAYAVPTWTSGLGLLVRLGLAVVAGGLTYGLFLIAGLGAIGTPRRKLQG